MSKVRLLPSAGFVLMVCTHALLLATLAWGASTPELERVWVLTQNLQRQQSVALTPKDVNLLRGALTRYPTLPRVFIGRGQLGFVEPSRNGWNTLPRSHIITSAQLTGVVHIQLECQAPATAFPVTIMLERASRRHELRFTESGRREVVLEFTVPHKPELIAVTVSSASSDSSREQVKIALRTLSPPGAKGSP